MKPNRPKPGSSNHLGLPAGGNNTDHPARLEKSVTSRPIRTETAFPVLKNRQSTSRVANADQTDGLSNDLKTTIASFVGSTADLARLGMVSRSWNHATQASLDHRKQHELPSKIQVLMGKLVQSSLEEAEKTMSVVEALIRQLPTGARHLAWFRYIQFGSNRTFRSKKGRQEKTFIDLLTAFTRMRPAVESAEVQQALQAVRRDESMQARRAIDLGAGMKIPPFMQRKFKAQ